jgi:hypothetical protein
MPDLFRTWWRLGGVSGGLFVVLSVAGVVVQHGVPAYSDSLEEIREFWVESGQRYLVGDYLLGLAFTLFYIPFFVTLTALLRRAEGDPGIASTVAFIGAIAALLWSVSASVFWGTLAFADFAQTASDETLRTLTALDVYATSGQPFTFAVFIGAASYVIYRRRILWRWLAYPGVVVAVSSLLAPLGILTESSEDVWELFYTVAFLGFALWILLASVAMATLPAAASAGESHTVP